MTDDEIASFLAEPHKLQLATINPDGTPHLVTMYYAVFEGLIGFWTYRTSQKAVNLARDPRLTCLVEAGSDYDDLRGVQVAGEAETIEDTARVREFGEAIYGRYLGTDGTLAEMGGYLDDQARKRNAYLVHPRSVASWDHRKLAEVYAES